MTTAIMAHFVSKQGELAILLSGFCDDLSKLDERRLIEYSECALKKINDLNWQAGLELGGCLVIGAIQVGGGIAIGMGKLPEKMNGVITGVSEFAKAGMGFGTKVIEGHKVEHETEMQVLLVKGQKAREVSQFFLKFAQDNAETLKREMQTKYAAAAA